ncbi:hypothetical protein K7432_011111 [Basidiobolus ranarum]|uniref:Mitochondrial import inner membrane translocase subunit TIM50 n=1 Tax=Basidiobolus ranarum TaxID=34480 RepID=A0ABR2WMU4_9FUNG
MVTSSRSYNGTGRSKRRATWAIQDLPTQESTLTLTKKPKRRTRNRSKKKKTTKEGPEVSTGFKQTVYRQNEEVPAAAVSVCSTFEHSYPVLPKNLMILDLNGTLLVRNKKSKAIYMRPHVPEFVEFILKNFAVIVWSSAMPDNVYRMILKVFKQRQSLLLDVWDRSHLRLNQKDYFRKVDVIKDLSWIWEKHTYWDSTNTVLIDDTEHKGQLQPNNHICLREFMKGDINDKELLHVQDYLQGFLKGETKDIRSYIQDNRYVPSKLDFSGSDHSDE